MHDGKEYDYVVVGAGSAGATVASRLSEDPTARVLLLEEGGDDHVHAIEHSFVPTLFETWTNPAIAREYPVRGTPEMTAPGMLRGIVRGGCGSINGMIYIRGNRRDFDGWAASGCEGWSYDDLLGLFRGAESFEGGPDAFHGGDGPLHVRRMITPTPVAGAFVRAGIELGYAGVDPDAPGGADRQWDFNGETQEDGVGLYQVNVTPDGRRASASACYLDPHSFTRPNLEERTGVLVRRVVIEKGRAVGVDCLIGGVATRFRAAEEVILCGGSIGSPQLLALSGIGPADDLRRLGIEPVVDLPGVGANLHDHLLVLQYFGLGKSASAPSPSPKFIAEAGLFTHALAPKDASPDLQYHFAGGMTFFGPPADCIFCPTLAKPKSRGRLALLSDDPRHPPLIDPNYLAEPDDVAVLEHGMELSRRFADTKAFEEINGGRKVAEDPVPGGRTAFASDADYIRATARTVWHPVGTCRMGPARDPDAVVDPALRVRGVEKLRVADASVMPEITSGNTNAATIVIGEKAARMIRADREAKG